MHKSLDGFIAGPNGEMNWKNINYEFRMMNYESGIVTQHSYS